VLKNLSNLLALAGDWVFFRRVYGGAVWGCVGLMVLSALAGGATDTRFSAAGYAWQLANCVATSGCAGVRSGEGWGSNGRDAGWADRGQGGERHVLCLRHDSLCHCGCPSWLVHWP
jgi:hypothetical protein